MKKYYCNRCGHESNKKWGKCLNCGKSRIVYNMLFIDYLLDQTGEDTKGKVLDTFVEKVIYFIKKYIYGIALSLTIVGTVAGITLIRPKTEIVHEKPTLKINMEKEYLNLDSLITDIKYYLRTSNDGAIANMLYQKYYSDEAQALGIDALDSVLLKHTHIGAFEKGYSEIVESQGNDIIKVDSYCKKSNGLECLDLKDLSTTAHTFYSLNLYIGFYWLNYNDEEKTFVGKDDFDIIVGEADGKYYLVDIITYISDPYIESVNGDSSKLDYDKQMRYYVDGILEE